MNLIMQYLVCHSCIIFITMIFMTISDFKRSDTHAIF